MVVIGAHLHMSGDQDTDWRTLEECGHTFCYDCLEKSFHMDRAIKRPAYCPSAGATLYDGIWAVDELTFKTFLPLGRQSETQTQSQSLCGRAGGRRRGRAGRDRRNA